MSAQPSTTALTYQGALIAERGEQLSLTDMWKAAGSDPSRAPAEWLRSADATRFIDFVAEVLNMGNSHDDLIRTVRGGKHPGTWAHWQVCLACSRRSRGPKRESGIRPAAGGRRPTRRSTGKAASARR